MQLRDYQQKAVDKTMALIKKVPCNPIIAAPTGVGKSVIVSGLVLELLKLRLRGKVLMLTHKRKLIEQNFIKLLSMSPQIDAGINCAAIGRRENDAQVIYASIQSVVKKPNQFGVVSAVIIDECHLVSPNAETSYQKFLAALREKNPKMRVIGLSATPYRMGLGYLTQGGIFDTFSFDMTSRDDFLWFIKQGYLSPLIARPTVGVDIDLSGVRKIGGEFVQSELAKVTNLADITNAALDETVRLGVNRKKWLMFCTGIEHTENVTKGLLARGIKAKALHSQTREKDEEIFRQFEFGEIQALVSAEKITTGFDAPDVDMIGMLRATDSPGLFCQALGRGTRVVYENGFDLSTKRGRLDAIAAGPKQNCLVLDFPRNTERLGPINNLRVPTAPTKSRKKQKRRAPVKTCDECGVYVAAQCRTCPECDYKFPVKTRIQTTPGCAAIIDDGEKKIDIQTLAVDDVSYMTHRKAGRPDSLKVVYKSGLRRVEHYLCFDHGGFAARNAREWWRAHKREGDYVPENTKEALQHSITLQKPTKIEVNYGEKYPTLVKVLFD